MNFVEKTVKNGGRLAPIIIPDNLTNGTGLMNPSVFIDDDGDILVNLRHVNYTLYHSEKNQRFMSPFGPLAYLHPENHQILGTDNYICRLNKDLEVTDYAHVDMMSLHTPIWEFHGLEDCRLVQWDGDYYLIGVRRDTTPNGQGRMEYSRIVIDKANWKITEQNRVRIPTPVDPDSYCEKNWVPIIDMPYHFVKWSLPTEVVKADPNEPKCEQLFVKETPMGKRDPRGGSQVIPWGEYYISFPHEVNLYMNYLNQRDGIYRHRMIVWDKDFNFKGLSKEFSFLDAQIEFCVGAAKLEDDLLLTFGFQDNAAFILRTPKKVIDELLEEALQYED
jgi:hypothetical protein